MSVGVGKEEDAVIQLMKLLRKCRGDRDERERENSGDIEKRKKVEEKYI